MEYLDIRDKNGNPTGVIKEHLAVRTACGLFDVSHMGEIICEGEDEEKAMQEMARIVEEGLGE